MSVTLSNLASRQQKAKKRKRVGRGNASGHGTYSTRGLKGQKARSGGRRGLKRLGLRMTLRGIPKKRGFSSLRPKAEVLNIKELEERFPDGATIDIKNLIQKGLVSKRGSKKVKILGEGRLSKKFTVKATSFSEAARKAIIQAGGSFIVLKKKK